MNIKTNWDLVHYYYQGLDDPALANDIDALLPEVESFCKQIKGTIGKAKDPQAMLNYYVASERINALSSKPGHYLFYLYALDTQNTEVQKRMGELEVLGLQINEMMLFVSQEFKELGEEKIREFADMEELKEYRNDLLGRADTVKYLLEENQEFVLNKKARPLGVLGNIHDELRNSLTFSLTIDGKKKTMTEEEVRMYARDPDRSMRKKAAKSMKKSYLTPQNQIVFGNTYAGIVKNAASTRDLRGYDTVMTKRNISEELDDEVVDLLIKKVSENYPLNQRFLAAKKKHFGYKKLKGYDVHAPIHSIKKKYTIEEALQKHLDVMQDFDQEFYDYSLDMFERGRVDVDPAHGKRGGAFASYSKDQESFVLLNFTGTIDDIFTLSHELGHAIHGHLAQGQKDCVYDSPLCLAETASIFNEMLLTKSLEGDLSSEEYTELLNQKLMDVTGTIFRQVMYTRFERRVHEEIASGKELTYKEFNLYWDEASKELSGDEIHTKLKPEENFTWSVIPHIFHTPFYCYTYAFGMILSFSLMSQYEQKGPEFIKDYKAILASGGSERPRDLLLRYGIDIAKDAFYDDAFASIEKIVEEFES